MCNVMSSWAVAQHRRPAVAIRAAVEAKFGGYQDLSLKSQLHRLLSASIGPDDGTWPEWVADILDGAPPTGVYWADIPPTGDIEFNCAMVQSRGSVLRQNGNNMCPASQAVHRTASSVARHLSATDAKSSQQPVRHIKVKVLQMTCQFVPTGNTSDTKRQSHDVRRAANTVDPEDMAAYTNREIHSGVHVVVISPKSVVHLD